MNTMYREIINRGFLTGIVLYGGIIVISLVTGLLALTGTFLFSWIILGSIFPAYGAGLVISSRASHRNSGQELPEKIRKKLFSIALFPVLLYVLMIPAIIGTTQILDAGTITGIYRPIVIGVVVVIVFAITYIGVSRLLGVRPDPGNLP